MKVKEELQKVLGLLKKEWEEDLRIYKQKALSRSLDDKKKEGICWYPVNLNKYYIGTGEKLTVELERTSELGQTHMLQSGQVVNFFCNADGGQLQMSGVVHYVKKDMMKVILNTEDVPDWIDEGKLGVELLFDEASYREMQKAMRELLHLEKGRTAELRDVLLGQRPAEFADNHFYEIPQLNKSQNEALNHALTAKDVAIIHGPPGTGKTTTMVQVIGQVLKNESQVLVCAPSNAAVDLLAEKLGAAGISVLRLGHPARVTEEVLDKTLDNRIGAHDSYKDLRGVRRKSEEYKRLALKYKRKFGPAEREQRNLLLAESRKMREEADQLEHYIIEDLLCSTQVIACTLVGSTHNLLNGKRFSSVFIDEAAQALEPACWIPILKADRVIFAGDHCQLPPTIKSLDAAREGLSQTLFEKCIERQKTGIMLRTQYRMHEQIMIFSSKQFYDESLEAHESVRQVLMFEQDLPLEFVDTAGCGFEEIRDRDSKSSYNREEGNLLLQHLQAYLKEVGEERILEERLKIGVISPYKAQVEFLSELLKAEDSLKPFKELLSIDTVDAFQGQERDIIYISLVRSNDQGEIGFLKDIRRMNVAMTRARKKLVVIGDSATLASDKFYDAFLEYVNQVGAYRSAYELLY
jgi:ATP-dependent RNA/DNA helicase IGHMBP2